MDKNEFVDLGKIIWVRMLQKKDEYTEQFMNIRNDDFGRKDIKLK